MDVKLVSDMLMNPVNYSYLERVAAVEWLSSKEGAIRLLGAFSNEQLAGGMDLVELHQRPVPLRSMLTEHECNFVYSVFHAAGCKIPDAASHWEDDGTEYGKIVTHWEKPESLGLVECVGSYKWKPTDKLVLAITGVK